MAKDVITIDGEDRVVREDTAKSYRGVMWAMWSILAFIVITAVLFFGGFLFAVSDGEIKAPAQTEQQRQQQ